MINSRILSMTMIATNMLNTNILDALINMNSNNTISLNMYTLNMLNQLIGTHITYRSGVEEVAVSVATLAKTGRSRRRLRPRYAAPSDLLGRRPVVEAASSRVKRFPKT